MFGVGWFLAKYGSKILGGAAILLFRYIEKTATIRHFKKKLDRLLDDKFDDTKDN